MPDIIPFLFAMHYCQSAELIHKGVNKSVVRPVRRNYITIPVVIADNNASSFIHCSKTARRCAPYSVSKTCAALIAGKTKQECT